MAAGRLAFHQVSSFPWLLPSLHLCNAEQSPVQQFLGSPLFPLPTPCFGHKLTSLLSTSHRW